MDAQAAIHEMHLKQWASIIRDRTESGMTINEYCAAKSMSRNAYLYWLRKVREAALEEKSGFVELLPDQYASEVTDRETSSESKIIIKIRDITVQIENGISPVLLRTVLRAVKDVE